ncbi:MAG: LLM class flavin-dependent oxidoreductase [Chloroflexi bacterium]|nr:LLM class flavin-dependent oxidoreductase [Chloroflexota bacterium]
MRYGVIITGGDPHTAAGLAGDAEAAGWDGVFSWDGIALGDMDTYDPWVVLAAMAMRTERIRLGAMVFAATRRRPWKLAREAITLDHLSNGRLIMPVGLGATDDGAFGNVGEPTDLRTRAELLDETLAILDGLWSGEPFRFEGKHYRFGPMTFRPRPVQRPRIPIWVVGSWPSARSMARAADWDGVVPQVRGPAGDGLATAPEHVREILAFATERRMAAGRADPWDLVAEGTTPADDPVAAARRVRPLADAGATWWIESDWDADLDALRRRIVAGPPLGARDGEPR